MATSTNYEELKYVWKAWHDASGAKIRSSYPKYVELSNKAAVANGMSLIFRIVFKIEIYKII